MQWSKSLKRGSIKQGSDPQMKAKAKAICIHEIERKSPHAISNKTPAQSDGQFS
jgi:hypothetical protein